MGDFLSMGKKGQRAVIGIDIGGTKTLCALFDHRFRLVEEVKFKTDPAAGQRRFTAKLQRAVRGLLRKAKAQGLKVLGVGVAVAGKVDNKNGLIKTAPNILCLENFALGKIFRRTFGLETVLGNDVQWGLYGEHQLGAGIGCSNIMGVFLGTGVGGAVIFNGQLYEGASGVGGQVGSILTHGLGGAETIESHGVVDQLASKQAIAGAALGMGAKQWAPHLYRAVGTDISKVGWATLSNSIRKGDARIRRLITGRLRGLGIALSGVVNFVNPDLLILGGGMTEKMPRLVLNAVERGLREYLAPEVNRALKVRVARLENRAGVYGAAKHAFERFDRPSSKE